MVRRFKRLCALWLVAQILLPFTAPFPICDLSDLLSRASEQRTPIVPASRTVQQSVPLTPVKRRVDGDGDYSITPPLVTATGSVRLVVAASRDGSSVAGATPVMADESRGARWRPFAAAASEPQRSQQPTVLRL